MLDCECYHCKNRSIGCHKFCSDYRKYRRLLEDMQAAQKRDNEGSKAYIKTYYKNNFRKK